MSKKYIALKAIQTKNADGNPMLIEPKSEKHSGLFTADYSAAQEARLKALGAIRDPEGVETHEKISASEVVERRDAPEEAVAPPKSNKRKGAAKADAPTDAEGDAGEGGNAGLLD